MSNYTAQDYKQIFNERRRKEQECLTAYNNWVMQSKMILEGYNKTIIDNNLQSVFPLIQVETNEDLEKLDLDVIRKYYETIVSYEDTISHNIEIALELKDGTPLPLELPLSEAITGNKSTELTQDIHDDNGFNLGFESTELGLDLELDSDTFGNPLGE